MTSFRLIAISIVLTLMAVAGCVTQPTGNVSTTTTANTASTNTTSTAAPPTAARTNVNYLPVTLPVLDAMFYEDESFKAALKEKLQLTDEQIAKLQQIAREETAKLNEGGNGDYAGTTSGARTSAEEKIRAVIGEEKTKQLSDLVRERWGGSSNEAGAAGTGRGNAVPNDTRIVVNAPAYRMDVFENGKLTKSYKVGIGYPEFPLPTGQRNAKQIIFNPTWTPPYSPWVKETSEVKKGQPVKAGSPANPLGIAKIPIGSPSLIHGGKAQAQIGGFASHGCVGLTNAQMREFAPQLARLGGANLTDEQIAEYLKNEKETKEVSLANAVLVELRYETIVVEDGKLYIYRDVYDHDTNTEEHLREVLQAYGVTLDQFSEEERQKTLNALKEMSRDARGRTEDEQKQASATASPSPSPNQSAKRDEKNKNATAAPEVTKKVKGQKEIVIEVAALKGKGYPAPVELNAGGASTKETGASGRRKR